MYFIPLILACPFYFFMIMFLSFNDACDLFAHIPQECWTAVCENHKADPMAVKLQCGWYAYMIRYEMEYFYVSIEGWIATWNCDQCYCVWERKVLMTDCHLTDTKYHYNDVVMSAKASQITAVSIVCYIVCSGADHRKHQSSALLVFVRGIHRSPVIPLTKDQ